MASLFLKTNATIFRFLYTVSYIPECVYGIPEFWDAVKSDLP